MSCVRGAEENTAVSLSNIYRGRTFLSGLFFWMTEFLMADLIKEWLSVSPFFFSGIAPKFRYFVWCKIAKLHENNIKQISLVNIDPSPKIVGMPTNYVFKNDVLYILGDMLHGVIHGDKFLIFIAEVSFRVRYAAPLGDAGTRGNASSRTRSVISTAYIYLIHTIWTLRKKNCNQDPCFAVVGCRMVDAYTRIVRFSGYFCTFFPITHYYPS